MASSPRPSGASPCSPSCRPLPEQMVRDDHAAKRPPQYAALFQADGVALHLTRGAVHAIAAADHTGGRAGFARSSARPDRLDVPAAQLGEQGVTDVLVAEETITEGKLPMLKPELPPPSAAATGMRTARVPHVPCGGRRPPLPTPPDHHCGRRRAGHTG